MYPCIKNYLFSIMTKLYKKQLLYSPYSMGFGNVLIYKIISDNHIRCHHVFMQERIEECADELDSCSATKGISDKIKSVHNWDDVWSDSEALYILENDDSGRSKKGIERIMKGKLQRGIMTSDGNSLTAVLVDKTGMYYISGGWS